MTQIRSIVAPASIATLCLAVGVLNAIAAAPRAEQDTTPPVFEVASIKKYVPDPSRFFSFSGNPAGDLSRWTATNATAKDLSGVAYGLNGYQMTGGPSWIDAEKFDVDAKVDDSMVPQLKTLTHLQQQKQMALMLRSLLADRFKLQVTRSTKVVPAFGLVVAKGGPKFKEAPPPDPQSERDYSPQGSGPSGVTITMNGKPMSAFMIYLAGAVPGRPVIDQTGLKGTYAFTLRYGRSDSPTENELPSIFTALEEQLGLRLENTKAPVDVLTIDHIEEPTLN